MVVLLASLFALLISVTALIHLLDNFYLVISLRDDTSY